MSNPSDKKFLVSSIFDKLALNLPATEASDAVRFDQLTNFQSTLQAAIDAEVASRTADVTALNSKIESEVSTLVNGAPEMLDTLN